jgi:hypothetical protein
MHTLPSKVTILPTYRLVTPSVVNPQYWILIEVATPTGAH